jgi:putative membrane protein
VLKIVDIHRIKLGDYMVIFIKSIIIGLFAIFPGVSGSAIAISLDIYDHIFLALKDIKKNILFLLIFFLGLSIGIILGSNILIHLSKYNNLLYYIFIGLIIGNIPSMFKKIKKILYIPLVISFLLSFATILLCNDLFDNKVSLIKMIFGGILFSFGKIFPGVSSSFFLIILGIYDKILILFGNPSIILTEFTFYFPFIVGIIIGLLVFVKVLNYLLLNKYDFLYSSLIGFIISSIISIFPKFENSYMDIIGIMIMIISTVISFKLNKKKRFN